MPDTEDTNAAVWKSDIGVSFWKSTQADREQRRAGHRALLAELLPFAADEPFTFVDLGAGTGAAARIILDHYPAAHAILADFSPQMMAQGEVELEPYEGRYRYVEYDLTQAAAWPAGMPDPVDAVISSLSVHHLERRPQADAVRGDPRAPRPRRLVPELRPGPAAGRRWSRRRGCGPATGGTRRRPPSASTGPRRSSSATRTTCGT